MAHDDKQKQHIKPGDVFAWFAGLTIRALEQGFEVVTIRRAGPGRPARIEGGYHGAPLPAAVVPLDEVELASEDPGRARAEFNARWRQIGSTNTPSTLPGSPSWTKGDPIEMLARQFLELHQVTERAKDVREQLLEEMVARGRTAVDVPNVGAVTLQPASTRQSLDTAGVRALVAKLNDTLRAHGVKVDEDALPMKQSKVAASLRVTLAPEA